MKTTVGGIQRFGKLMIAENPNNTIQITGQKFDEITKHINYVMDNWANGSYAIIKDSGERLAFVRGRSLDSVVELYPDFKYLLD